MRRLAWLLPLACSLACSSAAPPNKSADAEVTTPPLPEAQPTAEGEIGGATTPPPPPPPPPKVESATAAPVPMTVELSVARPKSKLSVSQDKRGKASPKPNDAPDGSAEPDPLSASTEEGQGSLKREQVQEVLAKHRDDFRPCVREDSVVRIDATITTSGAVAEAKSDKSTPDDPKLRDCVIAAFSKLTFPTDWARAGTHDATRLSLELRLRKEDA